MTKLCLSHQDTSPCLGSPSHFIGLGIVQTTVYKFEEKRKHHIWVNDINLLHMAIHYRKRYTYCKGFRCSGFLIAKYTSPVFNEVFTKTSVYFSIKLTKLTV